MLLAVDQVTQMYTNMAGSYSLTSRESDLLLLPKNLLIVLAEYSSYS